MREFWIKGNLQQPVKDESIDYLTYFKPSEELHTVQGSMTDLELIPSFEINPQTGYPNSQKALSDHHGLRGNFN